jgi:hypothetical protein
MASCSSGGSPPYPPPPLDIVAFKYLIASYTKSVNVIPPSQFIKKIDDIPKVPVHSSYSHPFSPQLDENGFIFSIYESIAISESHDPMVGSELEETNSRKTSSTF